MSAPARQQNNIQSCLAWCRPIPQSLGKIGWKKYRPLLSCSQARSVVYIIWFWFCHEKKSTWSTLNTKLLEYLLFARLRADVLLAKPPIIKGVLNALASELGNGGNTPVWFKAQPVMCNCLLVINGKGFAFVPLHDMPRFWQQCVVMQDHTAQSKRDNLYIFIRCDAYSTGTCTVK